MKKLFIFLFFLFFVLNLKAQNGESCPVGEMELVLNLNTCLTGTYTCCLYKSDSPAPIKCINMTMPYENKVTAEDFYCAGFYYWVVTGPVNFTTCYMFYTPIIPQLTFYNNCVDCNAGDKSKSKKDRSY